MTEVVDIRFGDTAAKLTLDCPQGVPSSVTSVTVYEDIAEDTGTVESALGAASLENVSTTFDAASGYSQSDPTKCSLTATTSLVRGRRYVATNAYGESEWIEIERIASADAVYSRTPLTIDFASGDTFASPRIQATFDSTWIADTNNLSNPRDPRPRYRAAWLYTVGGVVYRTAVYFNVTRYPFVLTVNAQDVDRLSRGWLARLPSDDWRNAGEAVIKEAERQVRFLLWGRELSASAQRNNDVINELIRLQAVVLVHRQAFEHGGVPRDVMDESDRRFYQTFETLIGEPKVLQQVSEGGAAGEIDRAPIWRR